MLPSCSEWISGMLLTSHNVQDSPTRQRMIWPNMSAVPTEVEKLKEDDLAPHKGLNTKDKGIGHTLEPNSYHTTPKRFRKWRHPEPLKAAGRVPIKIRFFSPSSLC